ncbi:hypothetical protein Tco_0601304 [Tanacetum coccineum]
MLSVEIKEKDEMLMQPKLMLERLQKKRAMLNYYLTTSCYTHHLNCATPIPAQLITTESPNITTAIPESDALTAVQLRVAKLKKDVSELKKIDQLLKLLLLSSLKFQQLLNIILDPKLVMIFKRNPANHALYHALMEALIEDENAMDKGVADIGKKTKRQRTKESDSFKKPSTTKETPKGKALLKGSKTDVVGDDDQPQDTSEPKTNKTPNQDWFKKSLRPRTPDPKWNKRQVVLDQPEQSWFNQMVSAIKDPITFNDLMATLIDFSKYTNLIGTIQKEIVTTFDLGHLTVVVDYFFNNDLEYLKTFNSEKTYTTSITKTKADRYEIFKKLHGYGHLEEVVVKRADRQLYKFKEGDFMDIHLNEIEDIMFTRSLIFKRRVEDLQLGVESYQKKLNITAPQQTFPEIEFKELYTPSYKPPGVIYEDLAKQKRVIRTDELYKFSDCTLKKVRDELHHRVLDFRFGYNKEMSRRKWTTIDKKRSELMVELLDKQMRERNWVNTYAIRNTKLISGIEDSHHGPSDAMHNPSQPLKPEHRVDAKKYSSLDGNPSRANIKQALRMPLMRYSIMRLIQLSSSSVVTSVMHSFEAARYTITPSPTFGAMRVWSFSMYIFISSKALSASLVHVKFVFSRHPFSVLKNGKDFSALLDRNLLRV